MMPSCFTFYVVYSIHFFHAFEEIIVPLKPTRTEVQKLTKYRRILCEPAKYQTNPENKPPLLLLLCVLEDVRPIDNIWLGNIRLIDMS